MANPTADPVGTLDDVRERVDEYEANVRKNVVAHHSISRDRAFLLSMLDKALGALSDIASNTDMTLDQVQAKANRIYWEITPDDGTKESS